MHLIRYTLLFFCFFFLNRHHHHSSPFPFFTLPVPKKAESWELPATARLHNSCLSHTQTHSFPLTNFVSVPYVLCRFTDDPYSRLCGCSRLHFLTCASHVWALSDPSSHQLWLIHVKEGRGRGGGTVSMVSRGTVREQELQRLDSDLQQLKWLCILPPTFISHRSCSARRFWMTVSVARDRFVSWTSCAGWLITTCCWEESEPVAHVV